MSRRVALILAAVLASPLFSTSSQALILFSDGFEAPVVNHTGPSGSSGGYDNYGTGAAIGPWTVVGPPGATDAVSVVTDNFTQNGFSFVAQSGKQWADLAGQDANGNEGVETTLSGLLGKSFTVSFWIGNVVDPGNVFGTTTTVKLLINNVLIDSYTNSQGGPNQKTQLWQNFTYSGIATSDSLTFTFLSADPRNDFSSAFDNVEISTPDVNPVPGPVVGAGLPGLGMSLAGLMAWRRRRMATA